jgi:hypothetical protein
VAGRARPRLRARGAAVGAAAALLTSPAAAGSPVCPPDPKDLRKLEEVSALDETVAACQARASVAEEEDTVGVPPPEDGRALELALGAAAVLALGGSVALAARRRRGVTFGP